MLDVHPPHEPVHGWRDFAVHLLTITAGLLIALALESAAEAWHHHELAAQARENIERELALDADHAKENAGKLQGTLATLDANLAALRLRRDGKTTSTKVHVDASWTSFEDAAWLTARESGALGYMPLDEVQRYAALYAHQQLLQTTAMVASHDVLMSIAPSVTRDTTDHISPDELQLILLRTADAKVSVMGLQQMVDGLRQDYVDASVAPASVSSSASGSASAPASSPASARR